MKNQQRRAAQVNGKVVGVFLAATAVIGGIGAYALNVYAFYEDVPAPDADIQLTLVATQEPESIFASDIEAIDATSSPLRFRACFTTTLSQAMLTETYVTYENAVPLTGPGWFDCYDAAEIGAALEGELAIAYLSQENVHDGVDRVVAIFDDGRGYAWHQLNEELSE